MKKLSYDINALRRILLSDRPLLVTTDGYRQAMVAVFPPTGAAQSLFGVPQQTYHDRCRQALDGLDTGNTVLTVDYASPEVPMGAVAYHRVWGFVTADSRYMFSTKQLERDMLAADANPAVTAHLLHVHSPGGEAYYLDRLSLTMQQLGKPVVTLYEMACSAAYHIACHAQRVYATTLFDFVGCIGTMVSFYDFQPYYDKLGIRLVEAKADRSDLKNKMFDDLVNGKPKQYIDRVLNPMNDDFLACVKAQRPKLAAQPDDAPVLRGETFFTPEAERVGLCDGRRTLAEAAAEAAALGSRRAALERGKQQLYSSY